MNFFDHKDLDNHLLQLCPKVVKHPVYEVLKILRLMTKIVFFKQRNVSGENPLRAASLRVRRFTDYVCVWTLIVYINTLLSTA